ncbi:MAG: DUF1761 domain-containing protein [Pseudomonadota bacterium]
MHFEDFNFLAILAAAIANMAVGAIWYAPPVMGNRWMSLAGLKEDELVAPVPAMIKAFLSGLFVATTLAMLIVLTRHTGVKLGAMFGGGLALLCVAPAILPNYLFEGRPTKLWLIHIGNTTLAFIAMGAIIGAWH